MEKDLLIDQLTKENELKTKWLSLIAHDFNGVFSNMNWLLEAYENRTLSLEQFLAMLPEIKQNVNQNQQTIQDTFEWVKRQADGFNPTIEEIDLSHLFTEVISGFKELITHKEIKIATEESQVILYTDRVMLTFILKRVLENAIKYSYIGGLINLETKKESSAISIIVTDYGTGMSENTVQSIGTLNSTPFTGTSGERGSNMSLVIVNEFIEMLEGTMKVFSKTGSGTRVELSFSLNKID